MRYNGTSDEYVKFSRAMGIPQQRQRVTVDGLGNIGDIKEQTNDFNVRPGKNKGAKANLKVINSKEYIKKFSDIGVSEEVQEKISKLSSSIIHRRDGTNIEEVYALDKKTGRVLSYAKGTSDFGTNMGEHFKNVLKNGKESSIIILHNHPINFTFSTSDVKTASKYKSIEGVIASTHSGDVHFFMGKIDNYKQLETDFRVAYTKHRTRMKESDEVARISAWSDTFGKRGIKFGCK